jgi:arginine decarboxylase
MNVSATDRFTIQDATDLYGLDGWGNRYLAIGDDGSLLVTPTGDRRRAIDVHEIVERAAGQGLKTPLLLRFPELLRAQVERLTGSFARAIDEFEYPERFYPVFPIKVNQQRDVVEGLLAAGRQHGLGLEVGSRAELLAAMAMETSPDSLIVCNGYKDPAYLSTASLAARLGKRVVIVIEKPFEIKNVLDLVDRDATLPMIGFRIRLRSRGSGLWEKSGGFASKFGLTTRQLLDAVEAMSRAGVMDRVALLHFHIGSQITEIRKIKNAVREGARIYAKLHRLGTTIRYLDVGGGLGIDYDGSRTSADASVNYSVQEYANDVVFGLNEVCEQEDVPPPRILSESGRWLTAYHAVLVTDVRGAISPSVKATPAIVGNEDQVVLDLAEVARTINVKNYREFYHDALEYRDLLYQRFNVGLIELPDRATGELLFWEIACKAVRFSKTAKFVAEEFGELEHHLHDKYICNFSVFQSLPDHWALDQLFPVIPAHRLNERPTRLAQLVDITCDSDGELDKFVDRKAIKTALEVHELRDGEPYYLVFALVGAYQDTMGDMHNLFGEVNEADIVLDADGRAALSEVRLGESARDALRTFGYDESALVKGVEESLERRVAAGDFDRTFATGLMEEYRQRLREYTYLD